MPDRSHDREKTKRDTLVFQVGCYAQCLCVAEKQGIIESYLQDGLPKGEARGESRKEASNMAVNVLTAKPETMLGFGM